MKNRAGEEAFGLTDFWKGFGSVFVRILNYFGFRVFAIGIVGNLLEINGINLGTHALECGYNPRRRCNKKKYFLSDTRKCIVHKADP